MCDHNKNNEIKRSIAAYKKAGIELEFPDHDTVIVAQKRLVNGYILTNKQLYSRANTVLKGHGTFKIKPVVYSLDVDDISIEWVEDKMKEFGIHRGDLVRQMALDKEQLSKYFSKKLPLPVVIKAAFFYYFLSFELNRDLRADQDEISI